MDNIQYLLNRAEVATSVEHFSIDFSKPLQYQLNRVSCIVLQTTLVANFLRTNHSARPG